MANTISVILALVTFGEFSECSVNTFVLMC